MFRLPQQELSTPVSRLKFLEDPHRVVLLLDVDARVYSIMHEVYDVVPFSLFSRRLVRVQVSEPYNYIDPVVILKNFPFRSSSRFDFQMQFSLFIAPQDFAILMSSSFSVEPISLPRYIKSNIHLRDFLLLVLIVPR